MARSDINLFIGPDKARELQAMLDWFQRFPDKAGKNTTVINRGSKIPHIKLGKAHDNIAPRTFGAVDIWSGKPGSETQLTFLTSPVQEFNLLDRTITAGKWCMMFGQYIFAAHWPALEIDATLSGSLAPGGTATASVSDFCNGDDPGSSVTVHASPLQGTTTIASGKPVYCTWDDRNQFYRVRGWGC